MSLVIFFLLFSFVDYVPVKGKIIWYLWRGEGIAGRGVFRNYYKGHMDKTKREAGVG